MTKFIPLESDPEIFNAFLKKLEIDSLEFVDVYGLDPDLLAFVPRPVRAVLMVFPVSKEYEAFRAEADKHYEQKTKCYWSPQTVGNTCGTMALLHALANGPPADKLGDGIGHKLIKEFQSTSPRSSFMETNETMRGFHRSLSEQGGTPSDADGPGAENHYICLTTFGKELVELDGRRAGPILRNPDVSSGDLLEACVDTIKEYMAREASSNEFALLALVDKN